MELIKRRLRHGWGWMAMLLQRVFETQTMKRYIYYPIGLFLISFLSSCELVAGIFKAGFWTGFIVVFGVIVLIIWLLVSMARRKK